MDIKDRQFPENPYHSPEVCGLKVLGELSKEPDYDFDFVIVFKDIESGLLYWGADSGCSCPTPFEDTRKLSDLAQLNAETFFNFTQACENISSVDKQEAAKFISQFKQLIRTESAHAN